MAFPDQNGRYGKFGGCFASEVAYTHLDELKSDYDRIKQDENFADQLQEALTDYLGRPAPLLFAKGLSEYLKGGKIYLKREDLNYTGSAAALNMVGQMVLAKRLGRKEVIIGSPGGSAALAASVAKHFGLLARIYTNQELPLLVQSSLQKTGAQVILREGLSYGELRGLCIQDWIADPVDRYYVQILPIGANPLPEIFRDLQSFIGLEIQDILQKKENRPPDFLVADISTALGAFAPFHKAATDLIVVEPVENIDDETPLTAGKLGIYRGAYTKVLQYANGQIKPYHSPCMSFSDPAAPPELVYLQSINRVTAQKATRADILTARDLLLETDGIAVSFNTGIVLAELMRLAPTVGRDKILVGVLHSVDLEM